MIGSRSPFSHGGERTSISKCSGGFSESESDISFVSSGRPSTDRTSSVAFDYSDSAPHDFQPAQSIALHLYHLNQNGQTSVISMISHQFQMRAAGHHVPGHLRTWLVYIMNGCS